MTADARFFLGSLQGLSEADAVRRVLPFPSPEVDPYRGLAPHLEVASARARALHALAAARPALVDRVGPRAAAAAVRSGAPRRAASRSSPGLEISPHGSRRAARARRLPARGSRWTSTASSASAAASSTSIRPPKRSPSASSSSATSSNPCAGTTRRRSDRSPRSIRSRSVRSASCCPIDGSAGRSERRRSIRHDPRLRPAAPAPRSSSSRSTTSRDRGRDARGAVARERGRHARRAAAPCRGYERLALDLARTSTPGSQRAGRRMSELRARERRPADARRTSPAVPAVEYHGRIGDWVEEIRAARERGDDGRLRRGDDRPRRADDRAARRLRAARRVAADADDLHSAAVLVTTGQLSRGFHLPRRRTC